MRILRLDLGQDLGTVDLHPFVSIIHGLSSQQREALLSAVEALATGSSPGPGGLVEADGRLIELPADGSNELGPFTTEKIVISSDDAVLDELDLPSRRAELDQMRRQAQIDAVYVEEVRADLRPSALADLQAVKDRLDGVAAVDPEVLEAETNVAAVRQAIGEIESTEPMIRETRDEVSGLVDRWDVYRASLKEARPHLDKLHQRIQQAEAALTAAIEAQTEAKRVAVPVMLTREEDARLEELSTESIDRRRRSKKRSAEEDAEVMALLAKVGQTTYSAYAMYRINPQLSPEHVEMMRRADAQVEEARAAVEDARAELSIDPVAFDLNHEYDGIKEEARGHLGPMLPDDLGKALAMLVDERPNPDFVDAVETLGKLLISFDVDVPLVQDMSYEELCAFGEEWARNTAMDAQAKREGPDRRELLSALERAEERFQKHAKAMARIDRMEAKAAESLSRVDELEQMIAAAESADGSGHDFGTRLRRLSDAIRAEAGAAAPLVLSGDFDGMDDERVSGLLDDLEPLAQDMQLIVVSERGSAINWARTVGLRRALRSTLSAVEA